MKIVFAFALLLAALELRAQSYSVGWNKISGGGGTSTSTNGRYVVTGTIGQADASGSLGGGNYAVTGGFWSLISVVQTPGAPVLYVSHSGNTVTVFWQKVSGWSLYQSGNLTLPVANWAASSGVTMNNGTNYWNITNPTGNQFFRLNNP